MSKLILHKITEDKSTRSARLQKFKYEILCIALSLSSDLLQRTL